MYLESQLQEKNNAQPVLQSLRPLDLSLIKATDLPDVEDRNTNSW